MRPILAEILWWLSLGLRNFSLWYCLLSLGGDRAFLPDGLADSGALLEGLASSGSGVDVRGMSRSPSAGGEASARARYDYSVLPEWWRLVV